MSKKYKEFVSEAISTKSVNHQLLSKHGYEHGGNDTYVHKSGKTVKLDKKGAGWTAGKSKGTSSVKLGKQVKEDTTNENFDKTDMEKLGYRVSRLRSANANVYHNIHDNDRVHVQKSSPKSSGKHGDITWSHMNAPKKTDIPGVLEPQAPHARGTGMKSLIQHLKTTKGK